MPFKDQVIWITGASSGIGAELAKQLSGKGARLILTARNEAALQVVAQAFPQNQSIVISADLTEASLIPQIVAEAMAAFGHIDAVIHSAGISQRSLAEETDMAVYRRLMEINFFAPVALTKALLPYFRKQGGGQIIDLYKRQLLDAGNGLRSCLPAVGTV